MRLVLLILLKKLLRLMNTVASTPSLESDSGAYSLICRTVDRAFTELSNSFDIVNFVNETRVLENCLKRKKLKDFS